MKKRVLSVILCLCTIAGPLVAITTVAQATDNHSDYSFDGGTHPLDGVNQNHNTQRHQMRWPYTIFAASEKEDLTSGTWGKNLTWTYKEGTLTISGAGAMESGSPPWSGFDAITTVIIDDGVTSIGLRAFEGCTSLTSVIISSDVTRIENNAFRGCTGLTNVTIPSSVTSIASNAFDGCTGLTAIRVDADNRMYTAVDGVLFSIEMDELILYPAGKKGAYIIPSSVTNIADCAFSDCSSLTSVTIPDGVINIGYAAFLRCSSLTNVTIPNGVVCIGMDAFNGCGSLASVTIPSSVTFVGLGAFFDERSVFEGYVGPTLKDVYYGGTEAQWEAMRIEADNTPLLNATIHYNSTGPEQPIQTIKFTDVPIGEWYYDAVYWAVANEITNGAGNNCFAPNRTCSHVQIITFLWRAAGKPKVTVTAPFNVASYYVDAVNWAYSKKFIDDSFRPDAQCTRSDTVTYMWKYAGSPVVGSNTFTDIPFDAPYRQAVNWAVASGVTTGTGDGTIFAPAQTCSRAQIVTFLRRLITNKTGHRYQYVVDDCSWTEAFSKAKDAGGYLAHIDSLQEYAEIMSDIYSQGLTNVEFRLGARRASNGRDYHWVDGNNIMLEEVLNTDGYWVYSEWADGEPSYEWADHKEEFVTIYLDKSTNTWFWNDVADQVYQPGKDMYGYIIEFDT